MIMCYESVATLRVIITIVALHAEGSRDLLAGRLGANEVNLAVAEYLVPLIRSQLVVV